ncbi:RNA polymerase III subunit RPC82-domain-containing protein [Hyaloraphidium curvatum]|nr:RNA polymerase III subunit RPC82-domain-containing protein [Hyaloraphidium curvatum]
MAHSGKLRLARQIIREHFGPVTEAVAWTLMTKGRLTLGAVHTLVNAQPGFLSKSRRLELSGTSIPMRSVKEAVFVLMQHNVATYAETVEGNIAGRPPVVYYSVSIDAILDRLQIPAIVHGARHRFGAEAGAALLAVFANGRLSLADLQSKAGASPELADYDMYELHKAFNLLVVKGYLIAVDEYDSMNDADLKISNENSELDSIGPVPTAKSVSAAKRKAAEKAREQYESKAGFGLKRKANDPVPSTSNSKRRKTGPDDAFVDTVDETVFWKVDFDRCSVITRNQQVVNLVRRHLNDTAGAIIAQMLEMVTAQMRHCGEIGELPSVTAFELARNLPSTLSIGMDYGDDPPGFERIVADYLEVMSMDYPNVLTRAQDRGAGSGFTVAFQRAADLIKLQEIERVIDQKLGGPSARIWGMVFQKGKLDDKQVTRLAMISPKETGS